MTKRSSPDLSAVPEESSPAKRAKKLEPRAESTAFPRRVKRSAHVKPAVVYLVCCDEEDSSTQNIIGEFGTVADAISFLTWISNETDNSIHQRIATIFVRALSHPKSNKTFSFSDEDAVSELIKAIEEETGKKKGWGLGHDITHMHKTWDAVVYYDQHAHTDQEGAYTWETVKPMGVFLSEDFSGFLFHKIYLPAN